MKKKMGQENEYVMKSLATIVAISEGLQITPSQLLAKTENHIALKSNQHTNIQKEEFTRHEKPNQKGAIDEYLTDCSKTLGELTKNSPSPKINPDSDLVNAEFAQNFQIALLFHHMRSQQPLIKQLFEFAFLKACKARQWDGFIEHSPVNPGRDVRAGEIDWSLKTEAAKASSKDKIKISKLAEARWIRNCVTPEDFIAGIHSHLIPHLNRYERIIVLKVNRHIPNILEYNLIEISKEFLLHCKDIKPKDMTARTANGSTSAIVRAHNGNPLWKLRFDGSVEKITVENLELTNCMNHASWYIPIHEEN